MSEEDEKELGGINHKKKINENISDRCGRFYRLSLM